MKTLKDKITLTIIIAFSGLIFYLFYTTVRANQELKGKVEKIDKYNQAINFEHQYLIRLLNLYYTEKKLKIDDSVRVFQMKDEKRVNPQSLRDLINPNKKNVVLRFTQLGCNSCSDSTFRYLQTSAVIKKKYNVIVLVDFSEYEYYLKWKKLGNIDYPVFWLKKGSLPFNVEKDMSSYLFVLNNQLESSLLFIPDAKVFWYTKDYINNL